VLNVSGPYAVGKDSLLRAVEQKYGDVLHRVSTLTTRPVSKEADPTYEHLDTEEFLAVTSSSRYIVTKQLSGKTLYATDLDEMREQVAAGKVCIHSIHASDDGAGALRRAFGPELLSIAVLPNGSTTEQQLSVARDRLIGRDRDSAEAIDARLSHQTDVFDYINSVPTTVFGTARVPVFDATIHNGVLETAVAELLGIFEERILR
jgi:guanylate kinase